MADPSVLRVLLVEDSEDGAALIVTELRRAFALLKVLRVETPPQFEAAIRDEVWNLIISDHRMSALNSADALKLLQLSQLQIPFVIVFGSIGEGHAVTAVKAGASDYVLEHELARLIPAVERELREALIRNERHVTLRELAETEEQLRKSERRFQDLFEFAPDSIVMTDLNGMIVLLNQQAELLFGYSREELLNQALQTLLPERRSSDLPGPASFEPKSGLPAVFQEKSTLRARRKDGSEFPADVRFGAIQSSTGRLWALAIRDVTERIQAEALLRESLREKEVLLKEVHHRVKNNLQIISSLLSMQAARTSDVGTRDLLEESNCRVYSMGLIHEMLQGSAALGRVDFAAYTRALCTYLVRSYGVRAGVELRLETERMKLNVETAMPCGLILHELVSNALKHAFKAERCGQLHVAVRPEPGGEFSLTVRDTGPGLSPAFQIDQGSSLGMQLIRTLTNQVKGRLQIHTSEGTTFSLFFKELTYAGA